MDYPDLCKSIEKNKCSVMDLLPMLIDIDTKTGNTHITPSCFMNEMQLTTEERLERLNRSLRKRKLNLTRALKVHPEIVVFQNFKPGMVYTVPLKLFNNEKSSVPIAVKMETSAYFTVKHSSEDVYSKIAPGMFMSLEVSFSADDFRDYNHKMTFCTDGYSFDVDLIAIGPRPLLDLPDKITLPTTAVNIQTEKTILVRNLGQVPAKFLIETTPPFTVALKRSTLKPDALMQLTIYFTPTKLGYYKDLLKIRYETGEILSVITEGVGEEASVFVSARKVEFKDTYMGLSNMMEVEIRNESGYKLEYKWKKFGSVEEEDAVKRDLMVKFERLKEYELKKSTMIEYYDVATEEANKRIYKRILNDQNEELEREDCLYFYNEVVVVNPLFGELWPRSKVRISLVFAPKAAKDFEAVSFLQITGLVNRIPVALSGKGLGPKVDINVEELDVGSIYIRAVHKYEIIILNRGPIPATVRYQQKKTLFGGNLSCCDVNFTLDPNTHRNVTIKFCSENRGKFTENVSFSVVESNEVLSFTFTGLVVCPLLHLECNEIDFKRIAIGCPRSRRVALKNPYQVPIEFNVSVPNDGYQESYTLEDLSKMPTEDIICTGLFPKEIDLKPTSGEVPAFGHVNLTITVVANKIGNYCGDLVINMWSSKQYRKVLPIKYMAVCPEIVCSTPKIDMKSMFIKQAYYRVITFENRSNFPGFFRIFCETLEPHLTLTVNKECHYIAAMQKIDVRVIISADLIGTYSGTMSMLLFGLLDLVTFCEVLSKTRGPSVDIACSKISIGEIPTLTRIEKKINMSNDSPIMAHVSLSCSEGFVTVDEGVLDLEPMEKTNFTLVVFGTHCGNFKSTLKIEVEDGDTDLYPVIGTCVGGSILCEPRLDPMFECGTILTERKFCQPVKLVNRGISSSKVYFSQHAILHSFKDVEEPVSVITIEPNYVELNAEESKIINVQAQSLTPLEVNAVFYIHTKQDNDPNISPLQCIIHAVFEEPTIAFNKNSFEFYRDVGVGEERKFMEDTLTLLNCTNTDLKLKIVIDKPFYMLDQEDNDQKMLSTKSIVLRDRWDINLIFNPVINDKRCFVTSGNILIYYRNHPKIDKIPVEGKLNYPNIEFENTVLDFECLPENTSTFILVLIRNVSPLKASFELKWHADFSFVNTHTDTNTTAIEGKPVQPEHCGCDRLNAPCWLRQASKELQATTSDMTTSSEQLLKEREAWLYLQHLLSPLVAKHYPDRNTENGDLYKQIHGRDEPASINKIFDVVPTKGTLDPYECQYLSVQVRPVKNQLVEARLMVQVAGGENDVLEISAKGGDIGYKLRRTLLDFGLVPFNEVCSKKVILENTRCVPFFYMVTKEPVWVEFKPIPGWMNIKPRGGYLKEGEKATIAVDYFPGAIGYFYEKIKFDIGFDETTELTIKGCAVFPQVYFNFPRPKITSYEMNRLSYGAIAELVYPEHKGFIYQSQEVMEPDIKGWVTLNPMDNLPSQLDIDMAIERAVIKKYLSDNLQAVHATYYNPSSFIPCNYAPSYVLDLGYVAIDSSHEVELAMFQYKPLEPKLMWSKLPRKVVDKGFSLFSPQGYTNKMLLFNPIAKYYKKLEMEESVEFQLHVIVQGGLKLALDVKAVVARPVLKIHHKIIDFENVICGNCLRKTIILQNGGNIPCVWSAVLQSRKVNPLQHFRINRSVGILNIDEGFPLDVFFEPRKRGDIRKKLVFSMNYAEDVVVELRGVGMMPAVEIIENKLVFDPVIPYSLHNKITATVTNFSEFPVEVFFVDYDSQIDFENMVIWTLCRYHQVPKIYITPRSAGQPLPKSVIKEYNTIIEKLKMFLVTTIENEYRQQIKDMKQNCSDESAIFAEEKNVSALLKNIPDQLMEKSYPELRSLLDVNMPNLRDFSQSDGNHQEKLVIFDSAPQKHISLDSKEGVLIIFYGAPETNYVESANRLGIAMRMPVYSLDEIIIEALLENKTLAAIKVNEEIDKAFRHAASEFDEMIPPGFDDYDEFHRRLDIIARGKLEEDPVADKKSKGGKMQSPSKPSSKKSSASSQKSSAKLVEKKKAAINLPGSLNHFFMEILKQQINTFRNGLIIETLSSVFISHPQNVLLGILEHVGELRFIQVVYYSLTREQYLEKLKASEDASKLAATKDERVQKMLDMDQEQIDAFTNEDWSFYRKNVLWPRKLRSLERRNSIKNRKGKVVLRESKTRKTVESQTSSKEKPEKNVGSDSSKKSSNKIKPPVIDTSEFDEKFDEAEDTFFFIRHILEFWDRKAGDLLKPLPKTPPKSRTADKVDKVLDKSPKSRSTTGARKSTKSFVNEDDIRKLQQKHSDESFLRQHVGIPLVILNGTKCEEFITFQLSKQETLINALKLLKESHKVKLVESQSLYSVLQPYNVDYVKHTSNVFIPYDTPGMVEVENETLKNMSSSIISENVSLPKELSKISEKSESFSLKKISVQSIDSTEGLKVFTPRLVLMPFDRFSYDFYFVPKKCGQYNHVFNLMLTSCGRRFPISLEGRADLPRIYTEPEMVFSNVFDSRFGHEYTSGYIKDEEVYNFAQVLVQNNEAETNLQSERQFNLISNSLVPTVAFTQLLEPTNYFSLENNPHGLMIHPNNSQFLKVLAHPRNGGIFENDLLITIKNNPSVLKIKLACAGCWYDVQVDPPHIVFERVLLNTAMKKGLVLDNVGMLGVNWVLEGADDFFAQFKPNSRNGYLKPVSKQTVWFEYKTSELVDVSKMKCHVDFYDKELKNKEPILTKPIEISAEVVDILLEYLPEINLKDVKVCTDVVHNYTLLNKSKYDIKYSVRHVDDSKDLTIKNYFSVEGTSEGILKTHQPHEVKIKLHGKKPLVFEGVPVFTFSFFDTVDSREVHCFDLKISARVFGSSFKLCPPEEVNFGHQMIGTEVWKEVILSNSGKYSFTYAVLSLKSLEKLQQKKKKGGKKDSKGGKKGKAEKPRKSNAKKKSKDGSKSTRSSKSSKSGKGSKFKIAKPTTLKEGIFALISSTGQVEPDEVAVVKIFCKPKKVGFFEEVVVFFVSESFGKTRKGQALRLKAKGCTPDVDFNNFEAMFKEIKVVEKEDEDLSAGQYLNSQPVFITESKELVFERTCLNVKSEVRMTLMNTGLIGATVNCTIVEGSSIFSVTPSSLHIEPYRSEYVTIGFKPVAINKSQGILEISVQMDTRKLALRLNGHGCLPEIVLIEPEINLNNSYSLNFNPLMVGSTARRNISIKNVGVLPCKVMLGVQNDDHGVFFLIPDQYPKLLQEICNQEYLSQEFNHTVITNIKPNETSTIQLEFKPNTEEIIKSAVKLYIINNPYEIIEISVTGEGYKEDIVFEGLETTNLMTSLADSFDSIKIEQEPNQKQLYYKLDFGYRFINKLHRDSFKIRNISDVDVYKFSFANVDKLTFIPAVGHLKPKACKDVVVAIYSKCPFYYDRVIVRCKIVKIKYLLPEHELLSWDDRQHFTVWKPIESEFSKSSVNTKDDFENELVNAHNKIKTTQERVEPPTEEIPGSAKTINIYFSVVLDYSSFTCDKNLIEIEDTLLFEKKSATFEVTNTSQLPIDVQWILDMVENYPKAISQRGSEDSLNIRNPSPRVRPQTSFGKRTTVYLTGKEKFLDTNTPRPKTALTATSTNFSTSSDENIHDSWSDYHLNPFTIDPPASTIPPGKSLIYTVNFSPFEIFEYATSASASIHNLKPGAEQLKISIKAKSLMPLYHFSIAPSNYLKVRKERKESCGMVFDENTKIIEFETIGICVPVISKFTIINPTGEDFSYKWERNSKSDLSLFQCNTPEGFVAKGKMAEASFTFLPAHTGIFESPYVFSIEKYNLRTDFLLVGKAREPLVHFNRQSVALKPSVMGIEVFDEIILRNDETIPLKFGFRKMSLYSMGRLQKIGVEPAKGSVEGKSEKIIRINFNPKQVGPVCFNVECKVERLEKPLGFFVEGNCFQLQPRATYRTEANLRELDYSIVNTIELSSLIPLKEQTVYVTISNHGKVGFYYKWELLEKYIDEFIKIDFSQKEGYIKIDCYAENVVTLKPMKHLFRKNALISLKVLYGPTYNMNLQCSTCRTKYKFSFKEYDFGMCLVQTGRRYLYETTLEITNNDLNVLSISIEPEAYDHLTIINKAHAIQPKTAGRVIFYFHPLSSQKYTTEIPMSLNGKTQTIKILGEGIPLEVELLDPIDKLLNLGPVGVGTMKRRAVKVVNKTKIAIALRFDLFENFSDKYAMEKKPVLEADFEVPEKTVSDVVLSKNKKGKDAKKGKKEGKPKKEKKGSKEGKKSLQESRKSSSKSSKNSKKSSMSSKKSKSSKGSTVPAVPQETAEEREKRLTYKFVKIIPSRIIKLSPQQITDFTIVYSPAERMPLFTNQIYYQVQNEIYPICMFKTCCVAAEYHLDQQLVNFGTVIKGCRSQVHVKLFNTGDIGGKYAWKIPKKSDIFSISPKEGYVSPNMAVTFTIEYAPTYIHCLSRVMAQCAVENFRPLNLELIGTCINLPPAKDTLKFNCQVREIALKNITIKNVTGYQWKISPSLNGQYFSVEDTITIKPGESTVIPISYHPLAMTSPTRKHESNLFFPLPEGQGILYKLVGETSRPKILAKIERIIPAKFYHTELLEVENWLPVTQQFTVINQINQPDGPAKVLYKLSGNSVIDVPPLESRTYKWIIYPLKEGKLNFKVKFRNMATNEYLIYEIVLTITKCESLDVIRMTTCARQKAYYKITLQNPIKQPALFTINTICPDLYFKNVLLINPYTTEELLVEYAPIVAREEYKATVEAKTPTLGSFPYTFVLKALPAQPEPTVYFQTQLGLSETKTVYLYNYQEKKAEFLCNISDPQFTVDQPIIIPSKEKGAIHLTFEPDNLGGFQSKITLTSPTLGEFVYPLVGNCVEPKPIGPYVIKENLVATIPFKNPFNTGRIFNFSVEPSYFYVKNISEYAKPKSVMKIFAGLAVSIQDKDYPVTGKLHVSCDDEDLANVKWVIYLKTEPKDE